MSKLIIKRLAITVIVFSITCMIAIYWRCSKTSSLDSIKVRFITVRKGDSLGSVAERMQKTLNGSGWKLALDVSLIDERAPVNAGVGGTALMLTFLAKDLNCEYIINEKDKVLVIYR